MRIAQVIPHFYPFVTGPGNAAFNLSRRLVQKGIRVCIFTTDFGAKSNPRREIMGGVEVNRSPIAKSFMQYFVTPSLRDEIERFAPDIVHAHNYRSYQTEVSYNYCRKTKTPLVISLHGTAQGYRYMSTVLGGTLPYVLYDKIRGLKQIENASAVIVTSSGEEREVRDFIGHGFNRLFKIPLGCEAPQGSFQHDTHNVLLVERVTRDRDPCPLIKAFSSCKTYFPDLKFNIVGNEVSNSSAVRGGTLLAAKKLVRELNLEDQVKFLGELHGPSLENEYRSADIFVYNSRYENFGLPILEAASHGIPIITTNVGIAPDLIENTVDGLIVNEVNDVDEFTKDMLTLLRDRDLRRRMGTEIKLKVESRLNWDHIVSEYVSMYEQVLALSNRRTRMIC